MIDHRRDSKYKFILDSIKTILLGKYGGISRKCLMLPRDFRSDNSSTISAWFCVFLYLCSTTLVGDE